MKQIVRCQGLLLNQNMPRNLNLTADGYREKGQNYPCSTLAICGTFLLWTVHAKC